MISAWRWLLLFAWAASAQAGGDAVQDCIAIVADRPGQAAIQTKDCPGLLLQLQSEVWPLTEPELDEEITLAQLRFLQRARQVDTRALPVDRDALAQLLKEVQQPDAGDKRGQWWKAINAWLDQLKSGDYEAEYQWLRSLLQAITPSESVARVLLYGSLALLVAMSLGLVAVELYHAGWLTRFATGRRATREAAHARPRTQIGALPDAADAAPPPPRRQLAALLDAVIDALAAQNLLPADATLTHRQLLRAAAGRSTPVQVFQRLVETAEPVLYGRHEASRDLLAAVRRDAQHVLKPDAP
ncbi:MAG TPA: DUF4129 domain-containing protein [Methylococcaceae bacterium]|nr:DUF4129 domain-containing protein [Methylococcaceae bacterium]